MKQNILVTGSNGQLGNEIQAIQHHYPLYTFFFTDVEELDILNATAVNAFVKDNAINYIINCAAYTAVDKAESDKELAYKINAIGPQNLAKAASDNNAIMVQVSTDFVFDGTGHRPYQEDDKTCPIGVYGDTKLDGEKFVVEACPQSYIFRTAWLYSAFGNNFVKTMIRLGEERDELGVIFDQVGSPTYAADLASAIMDVVEANTNGTAFYGIYHYSNEGVASWYDFTRAIHEIAKVKCKVSPIKTEAYPTPAKRPHFSVMDKSKIKATFGIEISYWREALKRCIGKL